MTQRAVRIARDARLTEPDGAAAGTTSDSGGEGLPAPREAQSAARASVTDATRCSKELELPLVGNEVAAIGYFPASRLARASSSRTIVS